LVSFLQVNQYLAGNAGSLEHKCDFHYFSLEWYNDN
jgi:hypothetical protein